MATAATQKTSSTSKKTPTAADYAFRQCPRCTVGVLQVIRFDPEALHEHGQTIEDGRVRSGGAVGFFCPSCETGSSEAINPTEQTETVKVNGRGESVGRA